MDRLEKVLLPTLGFLLSIVGFPWIKGLYAIPLVRNYVVPVLIGITVASAGIVAYYLWPKMKNWIRGKRGVGLPAVIPPPIGPPGPGSPPPGGPPPTGVRPPQPAIQPPDEERFWDNVLTSPGWFLFLAVVTLITYAGVFLLSLWLGLEYPGYSVFFSSVAFWGILAHAIFTLLRKVPEYEQGAGFFLAAGLMELKSGWAPIPYGIARLYTFTQNPIRIIVGTETTNRDNKPAEITYDIGGATIRDREPRRIKFADGAAAPGAFLPGQDPFPDHPLPVIDEPTRDRLMKDPANTVGVTCEPKVIIEMLISRVIPFVKRVGSLSELGRKVSEATMAVFQEAAGRMPVGFVLENQIIIEARITYAIEELVGEIDFIKRPGRPNKRTIKWGIDFRMAQILDIGFTHDLNKEIAKAAGLAHEGRGLAQKAEGEAEAIRRKGTAESEVLEKTTRAAGKGLEEAAIVIDQYEDAGLAAVELDARVRMMQAGNTNVVVTGGGSPLTEAAGVFGSLMGGQHKGGPTPGQPGQPGRPSPGKPGQKKGRKGGGPQNPPPPPSTPQGAPPAPSTPPTTP